MRRYFRRPVATKILIVLLSSVIAGACFARIAGVL